MGDQKIITSIGDSHAWHAWLKIPEVTVRTLGPMTMHGFCNRDPSFEGETPKDQILALCWGEIDCRCHVHKFPPYKECIDKLVEGYLEVIRRRTQGFRDVWLFNVVPPPRRDNVELKPPEAEAFPFLGSDGERLSYVRYMNEKLKASGFTFIDVYDQYADQDGFLNIPMSDGFVHICDEKPLKAWIDNKLKEMT